MSEQVSGGPAPRSPSSGPGRGVVEAIHIADAEAAPVRPVGRIRATPGHGLAGDRKEIASDQPPSAPGSGHDITLVEAEEIDALRSIGIDLAPGETRRNLTTRGIRLNDLVGRRFRVGAVECRAIRLCEPCAHLQELIGKPILGPLVHRAGIRADILSRGEIMVGDEVIALDDPEERLDVGGDRPIGDEA